MNAAAVEPDTAEITMAEAAAKLGRSESAVRRLITNGKARAVRRLGRLYVRVADLDALLAGEPVPPESLAAVG